jgi:hypothetical protein
VESSNAIFEKKQSARGYLPLPSEWPNEKQYQLLMIETLQKTSKKVGARIKCHLLIPGQGKPRISWGKYSPHIAALTKA